MPHGLRWVRRYVARCCPNDMMPRIVLQKPVDQIVDVPVTQVLKEMPVEGLDVLGLQFHEQNC